MLHGLPPVTNLDAGLALPSTRIYDRNERLLYEISPTGIARNRALTLDAVPPHCINALIATEDADFYHHPGVSVRGIVRAIWLNVRGGEVIAGGSTITQQVARNLLLDPRARAERTVRRKLRGNGGSHCGCNAFTTETTSSRCGSTRLTLAISPMDWMPPLTLISGNRLVHCRLPSVRCSSAFRRTRSLYDPLTNPDAAKSRQETVLRLMTEQGYITATESRHCQPGRIAICCRALSHQSAARRPRSVEATRGGLSRCAVFTGFRGHYND